MVCCLWKEGRRGGEKAGIAGEDFWVRIRYLWYGMRE